MWGVNGNRADHPDGLVDSFGRRITYARLSVTDRCDLRCRYCMAERMQFLPKREILTLEEMTALADILIARGVGKIRLALVVVAPERIDIDEHRFGSWLTGEWMNRRHRLDLLKCGCALATVRLSRDVSCRAREPLFPLHPEFIPYGARCSTASI